MFSSLASHGARVPGRLGWSGPLAAGAGALPGAPPAVPCAPPACALTVPCPFRHAGAMRPRRALCLLLLCAAAAAPLVRACTSALVGKACTDDGSWFLARTVDFELGNITGNLL